MLFLAPGKCSVASGKVSAAKLEPNHVRKSVGGFAVMTPEGSKEKHFGSLSVEVEIFEEYFSNISEEKLPVGMAEFPSQTFFITWFQCLFLFLEQTDKRA